MGVYRSKTLKKRMKKRYAVGFAVLVAAAVLGLAAFFIGGAYAIMNGVPTPTPFPTPSSPQ